MEGGGGVSPPLYFLMRSCDVLLNFIGTSQKNIQINNTVVFNLNFYEFEPRVIDLDKVDTHWAK